MESFGCRNPDIAAGCLTPACSPSHHIKIMKLIMFAVAKLSSVIKTLDPFFVNLLLTCSQADRWLRLWKVATYNSAQIYIDRSKHDKACVYGFFYVVLCLVQIYRHIKRKIQGCKFVFSKLTCSEQTVRVI